ncbi:hypothetical protein RB195_017452 [Necator americanus]|uniref:Uncharacterized protein n=1 Tax=Necator americanus TaxID=51031 RepID=A0ABR1C7G5_NECAM
MLGIEKTPLAAPVHTLSWYPAQRTLPSETPDGVAVDFVLTTRGQDSLQTLTCMPLRAAERMISRLIALQETKFRREVKVVLVSSCMSSISSILARSCHLVCPFFAYAFGQV